jgi:sugar lactone lactonase YvrE
LGATPAQDRKISIPDAPKLPYHVVQAPALPAGAVTGNVASVQLTKDGTLYSYQRVNPALIKWGKDGQMAAGYLNDVIARAHTMRVDPNGHDFWLADIGKNVFLHVGPNGDVLSTLGTPGQSGTWDEAAGKHVFNQPTDIAFAPNGDMIVGTGHGGPDPRIVRFDKNGKFIKTWAMSHPDGTRANVHTLVVNKKGEIYIGDREAKRIIVYDLDGNHLRDIQMNNLICGLFIAADGSLWMTAGEDGMIMNIGWDGKVLGWFGKASNPPGLADEFGEAHYMTITPDMKTIYVADTQLNRIMELQHN